MERNADLLALAHELADASGAVIRRHFRTKLTAEIKADNSPVTIADREAEQAIRAHLKSRAPGHGIVGEEFGADRDGAEIVWVIDPIDGTKSFVTGKPLFGTLIGCVRNGQPVAGIIDQPILYERWAAATGEGATFNGKTVRTRPCAQLGDAMLYATSPHMFPEREFAAFERVRKAVAWPNYGADCYAYGLVASGFADLVVEATLKFHDYCALVPVIEEAGGIITDWRGRALDAGSDGRVVAAGDRAVHRAALVLLAD